MKLHVGKVYKLTNPMVKERDFVHYLFIISVKDPNGDPVIVFNDLKYIGDNRIMYQHNLKGYLLEEVF